MSHYSGLLQAVIPSNYFVSNYLLKMCISPMLSIFVCYPQLVYITALLLSFSSLSDAAMTLAPQDEVYGPALSPYFQYFGTHISNLHPGIADQ